MVTATARSDWISSRRAGLRSDSTCGAGAAAETGGTFGRSSSRGVTVGLSTATFVPALTRVALLIVIVLCLAPAATASAQTSHVLVVGDSLAVGMQPHLGPLLPGSSIVWD